MRCGGDSNPRIRVLQTRVLASSPPHLVLNLNTIQPQNQLFDSICSCFFSSSLLFFQSKMSKRWIIIILTSIVLFGAGGVLFRLKLQPSRAGIIIQTNPISTVYINDEEVGNTPYEAQREPGEITLRLVPATNGSLAPWGTKLILAEGIKTLIKRDFGELEAQSAGEIVSFEKIGGKAASMAVVSVPDAAQVGIDGEVRGFTPIMVDAVAQGEHKFFISHAGYKEREVSARAVSGYKLTVVALLAQLTATVEASSAASESAEVKEETTMVEILITPTGFLRVRDVSSASGKEVAQVTPGKKYTFIEESKDKKWIKIEYLIGKEGWVAAEYTKKTQQTTP